MSGTLKTGKLNGELDLLSRDELKDILLQLCAGDSRIRFKVKNVVEERLHPRRLSSATPDTRRGSPSPNGRRRPAGGRRSRRAGGGGTPERKSIFDSATKAPRLHAFRNGRLVAGVKIASAGWQDFLDQATEKLGLTSHARRVFGEDGTELLTFAGLETDTRVWVSAGDPWRDPNMKGILQSPTRRALPADHRLASPPAKRVYAKRNGDASDDSVIVVARTWGVTPERAMQILLRDCTAKLKLFSAAKRIFDENGNDVTSVEALVPLQTVFVSMGEGWSDPENPAPHPTVAEIDANHRLLSKPAVSIQVLRNGSHPLLPRLRGDDHARVVGEMVVGNSLIKVLDAATERLSLPQAARKLYTHDGKLVEDFGDLVRGELYYASLGEAFIDPEDPTANAATHMAELTNERLRGKKRPRMMVFRNGTHNEHEAFMVVATEMNEVLEECTRKLRLTTAARTLYTLDGKVIEDLDTVENDQHVLVSEGEPFRDPYDPERFQVVVRVAPIAEDSRLVSKGKIRVHAHRNGWSGIGVGKTVVGSTLKELLSEATRLLKLSYKARLIFDDRGNQIRSMEDLHRDMNVYISVGEPFRSLEAPHGPTFPASTSPSRPAAAAATPPSPTRGDPETGDGFRSRAKRGLAAGGAQGEATSSSPSRASPSRTTTNGRTAQAGNEATPSSRRHRNETSGGGRKVDGESGRPRAGDAAEQGEGNKDGEKAIKSQPSLVRVGSGNGIVADPAGSVSSSRRQSAADSEEPAPATPTTDAATRKASS